MTGVVELPPWSNQDIVLFHGTTLPAAESILEDGVLLSLARPGRDFGYGFYATTKLSQAVNFASKKTIRSGQRGSVIEFRVERERLSSMRALAFVLGTPDATDYWSFVRHCREENRGHARTREAETFYDIVFGPVTKSWQSRSIYSTYDQVSFHTESSIALLNTMPRRSIIPV